MLVRVRLMFAFLLTLILSACASVDLGDTQTYTFATAAVAADHPQASQAGAEMLALGGNAVDAAVATSFALSVTRPQSCGIGGGGFMIIHLRDDLRHGDVDVAIDFRERAPAGVSSTYFESLPDYASSRSGHSVAIPGQVAGVLHALEKYGTLDRKTVMAPAIRLARDGFDVNAATTKAIESLTEGLESDERQGSEAGDAFLVRTYVANLGAKTMRNPEMAACLELIAEHGPRAFYEGPIAKAIVDAVSEAGGVLNTDDLAHYYISEADPLAGSFRGHTLLTMPLPSSGGITLLETLALVERHPQILRRARQNDPDYLHLLIESFKHAFADRAQYLGDPEFMDADPTQAILEPERLSTKADRIDMQRARQPSYYGQTAPLVIDAGTSHYSVVDAQGNAVACSETINLGFGSRVAVAEFGFCLNDQMDDFTTRQGEPNSFGLIQSKRNVPESGKRPLSSMTPTIVLDDDGNVEAVVGGSGGPRIITGVAQVLLNVLLFDMPAGQAVGAPRLHHQWLPDLLHLEDDLAGNEELVTNLNLRGHTISETPKSCVIQLIRADRHGGWQAASDARKNGLPAGQ